METFSWIPDYGAAVDKVSRVIAFKTGDNFELRERDGINFVRDSHDLTFSKRTETEATAIRAFLRARGAVESFLFRLPTLGAPKRIYVCRGWSMTLAEHNDFRVKAGFDRDFGAYVEQCSAPVFTEDPGDMLSLTTATSGASIYYSFAATGNPVYPAPDRDDTYLYSAPFPMLSGTYFAIAIHPNLRDSNVSSH